MTDTHVRDDEARQIRSESGFTLVELLIVIVILGILTAVVVFSVGGLRNSGNLAACKAQARTVETAFEAYNARQGTYPGTAATPGGAVDALPAAGAVSNATATPNLTRMMGHLTSDVAPGTAGAQSAGIKLLKSAPDGATWAGTLAAPTTPTNLPTPDPGESTYSGSFVTAYFTVNAIGPASNTLTIRGWYMNGGVATACPI